MKLSKAILIKESYLHNPLCNLNKEEREADNLSIEALKAVKDARANNYYTPIQPLPGETKD